MQVLREFYSAVRRLSRPLSYEEAQEAVRDLCAFSPLPEDARLVLGAVRRSQEYTLTFWDALIVESALSASAC